jgi:hypothetical protein
MTDETSALIANTFREAIDILDETEPAVREAIESGLMRSNPHRFDRFVGPTTTEVNAIRLRAFRRIYVTMASFLPPYKDIDLDRTIRAIAAREQKSVHMHILRAAMAGLSNTDTAHVIIGSRRLNGVNGLTEQTRRCFSRLGREYLQRRRANMGSLT